MLRLGSVDPTVRSGPSGIVVALTDCVVTLRWECFGGSTTYRATFDGTLVETMLGQFKAQQDKFTVIAQWLTPYLPVY